MDAKHLYLNHECQNIDTILLGHRIVSLDGGRQWLLPWNRIERYRVTVCYVRIKYCPFCGEKLSEDD